MVKLSAMPYMPARSEYPRLASANRAWAPRAHSDPAEEQCQQGKRNGTDKRPAAANTSAGQEGCHDEQANGIEDKKCAYQSRGYGENSTHGGSVETSYVAGEPNKIATERCARTLSQDTHDSGHVVAKMASRERHSETSAQSPRVVGGRRASHR